MKKYLMVGMLSVSLLGGVLRLQGVDGAVRWRDYLPSKEKLQCYLDLALVYTARSYQQAVLAALAVAGDSEAIKAWEDLMATYNPSELICMVGGQGIDQLAAVLTSILPSVTGLSWAARQALEVAIYRALETVRVR